MPAYQGICLIEIERVQAAEKRFAEHFLKRIFTPGELDYCGAGAARPQRLAARFAAKASVRAALRQAGLPPLPYHLIEIERDEWGMPHLKAPIGVTPGIGILISLSHTRTLAAACAAIVQDTGDRRG